MATQPQLKRAAPEIERLFQYSLFLLIVTGFVTLSSTGKLDLLSVLFVSGALVFRLYDLVTERNYHIPERWTSYLGIVYVVVYLADFFLISQSFVTATVHLVLFGMTLKIFSIQRERDHVYLAILAFVEVLSASILTVDTVFLGAFATFSLVSVVTFIAMEMRRSSVAAANSAALPMAPARQGRRWSPFVIFGFAVSRMAVFIVIGMLASASVIFFALPRLSYGYLSKFAQDNSLVSGFSDNVSLGEIGRIQQSSQVVAHIQVDNDPRGIYASNLYLRGSILTKFDGTKWTNPPHQSDLIPYSWGGHFSIIGRSTSLSPEVLRFGFGTVHKVIRYRVEMEPIGTNVIFLLSQPRYLIGRYREISVDSDDAILNQDRDRIATDYYGISDVSQPLVAEVSAISEPVPEQLRERYMSVPSLDPKIDRLARSLTEKSRTPYEKAATIQQYLTTQFGYTLELPSSMPPDPLSDFLFHRKRGHCEYFASAMAIMLRQAGIPSRIVTGFRGGEFNQLTGGYIIRAKDAHAWVEGYIPGVGWMTFDPTPVGSTPVVTVWQRMELYLDAAREFWREWIINYDVMRQQQLTQKTVNSTRDRFRELRVWGQRKYQSLLELARLANREATNQPRKYSSWFAVALAVVLLLWNLGRLVRNLRRRALARDPRRAPQTAASIWYERMSKAAARQGYRREPSQTPQEFARTIGEEPMRTAVSKFTERYERARFDNSAEDAAELPQLFEEIETRK